MNACRKHAEPIIFASSACPWCESIEAAITAQRVRTRLRRADPAKAELERSRRRERRRKFREEDPAGYAEWREAENRRANAARARRRAKKAKV